MINTIPSLKSLCLTAALPLCNVKEENFPLQEPLDSFEKSAGATGSEKTCFSDMGDIPTFAERAQAKDPQDMALLIDTTCRKILTEIFSAIPGFPVDVAISLNPLKQLNALDSQSSYFRLIINEQSAHLTLKISKEFARLSLQQLQNASVEGRSYLAMRASLLMPILELTKYPEVKADAEKIFGKLRDTKDPLKFREEIMQLPITAEAVVRSKFMCVGLETNSVRSLFLSSLLGDACFFADYPFIPLLTQAGGASCNIAKALSLDGCVLPRDNVALILAVQADPRFIQTLLIEDCSNDQVRIQSTNPHFLKFYYPISISKKDPIVAWLQAMKKLSLEGEAS